MQNWKLQRHSFPPLFTTVFLGTSSKNIQTFFVHAWNNQTKTLQRRKK